jgi:hypothetical protein
MQYHIYWLSNKKDNGGHIWKTLGFMGLYYIFIT